MKTLHERILLAREKLIRDGWRKGSMGDRDRPCCLVGSLIFTRDRVNNDDMNLLAQDPLVIERSKNKAHPHSSSTARLIWFNDHEETSFMDVIGVVDRALEKIKVEKNDAH